MNKRELIKVTIITSPIILTLRSGSAFASCVNVGELGGKVNLVNEKCAVTGILDNCSGQSIDNYSLVEPIKTGSVYHCPSNAFVVSSNAFTSLT